MLLPVVGVGLTPTVGFVPRPDHSWTSKTMVDDADAVTVTDPPVPIDAAFFAHQIEALMRVPLAPALSSVHVFEAVSVSPVTVGVFPVERSATNANSVFPAVVAWPGELDASDVV